jgi:energy-converting hydrogenase Eha subunit A
VAAEAMTAALDPHEGVLGVHIAAGAIALVLGALTLSAERAPSYRSRAGSAYQWTVLALAITAIALVGFEASELWWLALLAAFSYGLALVGYLAPTRRRHRAWIRAYAHGQGGSYIALVTALLVVSLNGAAAAAAWIVPTLIGLPMIERRVARITHETTTARRKP